MGCGARLWREPIPTPTQSPSPSTTTKLPACPQCPTLGTIRPTAPVGAGTLLGNPAPPQTDPHEKALDSNVGTKKTAGKWTSHQSLVV